MKKGQSKAFSFLLKLIVALISVFIVFECFKEFSDDANASEDMGTLIAGISIDGTWKIADNTIDVNALIGSIPGGNSFTLKFVLKEVPVGFDSSTLSIEALSGNVTEISPMTYKIDTTGYYAGATGISFKVKADDCSSGYTDVNFDIVPSSNQHTVEIDMPDVTYGEYSEISYDIYPFSSDVTITCLEILDAGDSTKADLVHHPSALFDAGTYTIDFDVKTNTEFFEDYHKRFTHVVHKAVPSFKINNKSDIKADSKKEDIKTTLTYTYDGSTVTVPSSGYKLQFKPEGGSFSDDFPDTGGEITVKVVYLDSNLANNLEEVSDTIDLPLADKDPGKVKVEVSDIKYGQSPKIKIETDDYNKDNAYITYKKSGEPDENYTREVPTIPESYVVRVIFPETEKFAKYEETFKFKISKIDGTGEITAKDCYVGTKPQVTVNSKNYDADKVIIEYKPSAAQDSSYTKTVPERPGTYTVRATFPENECYLKYTATTSLKLTYITSPGYSISGIKGKNNFYVSDVSIKAPAGYLISTSPETGFVNELKYSTVSQSKYVYFKEISTGALSDKVDMPVFSIDNKAPAINKKLITNGIIFKDQEEFTINDDNLESVTVNGNPVLVTGGRASFTLLAKGGQETYEVIATDKAGNQITYSIIISAPWRETGIIPIGQKIRLEKGTEYSLDEGSWTVSGDDTVYCGGMSFYATSEEEVAFTRK